jgi:hypothetical protein
MILAYFFPYQANAKREKPLIFTVDPNLQKPLIIYCPCPHELKRLPQKVNRPIPKKVSNPKKDQQPIKPIVDRNYGSGEIQDLIRQYSQQFGISAGTPLAIAKCESGFNQYAANKSSSARSIFQYLSSTWANTPEGKQGLSVYDADAHIRAAVRHIATHGTAPWNASKHCWNK